jgi:hypothetical protein
MKSRSARAIRLSDGWLQDDFGGTPAGVLQREPLAAWLKDYQDPLEEGHDWALNAP